MRKDQLRALSIIQPWAHCITFLGKNIENRDWNTKKRGFIAIHSSARFDRHHFEGAKNYKIKLEKDDVAYGSIIGFARIVDVVEKKTLSKNTKKWFQGKYGFVLEDIIPLKAPVKVKGALGFWKVTAAIQTKCFNQLSSKNKKMILANLID